MNAALLALFFLSGWSALTHQVVWTRWLGLTIGTFATANATVTGTFMAGLALGYWLFGRPAARRTPAAALAIYGWLTGGVAVFALVSPWLLGSGSPVSGLLAVMSSSPLLRAAACALLILPPTILMGGTLPAMLAACPARRPGDLARLYAANTLGAALGPLTAGFALIPAAGLAATARTAGVVEVVVAITALGMARRYPTIVAPAPLPEASTEPPVAGPVFLGLLAFTAGALSLAFEIALTHLVILTVTGGSIYGLSLTLAAYLGGLGIGALAVSRWHPRTRTAALIACAAALVLPWIFALTRPFWGDLSHVPIALWRMGLPFPVATAVEFCVVLAAMLPVAISFGVVLPALSVAARADTDPAATGTIFAMNTAGAVLGAPIAGFLLLPWLGLDLTLALLAGMALMTAASAAAVAIPRRRYAFAVLALAAALPALLPHASPVMLNVGGHYRSSRFASTSPATWRDAEALSVIRYEHDGLAGHVAVRDIAGRLTLVVNGKPDSSNDIVDATTMVLNGALPLLLHPAPDRVLLVGLGCGITAGVALRQTRGNVTCVEIDPGVVRAARWFDSFTGNPLDDPRFRLVLDDGRHFLRVTPERYDVIISEPSNLYVAGTVSLFTAEYFRLVRSRLAPGGLFCLWMHYYGASLDDCRTVIRTVASVFPGLTVWINHIGSDIFVMAGETAQTAGWDRWKRVLATPATGLDLYRIRIGSPVEIASLFQFGPGDARAFAGPGPLCTDDLPLLEFTTPLVPYTPDLIRANQAAFDAFPVTEPAPLAGASRNDRRMLARAARAANRPARAELEERTAALQ